MNYTQANADAVTDILAKRIATDGDPAIFTARWLMFALGLQIPKPDNPQSTQQRSDGL